MSDILTYSQIQEANQRLKDEIASLGGGGGGVTWNPNTWTSLPMLNQKDLAGSFVVGHSSNIGGCGCSCTWTVPAGATKVQFQVWGAGANGTGAECCGMGFAGANGAYATTIIDVTPGDQYVLCAGCAFCCCLHYGAISGLQCFQQVASDSGLWVDDTSNLACPSYVTGNGLTNFCADGARQWEIKRWFQAAVAQINGVEAGEACNYWKTTTSGAFECTCFFNYGRINVDSAHQNCSDGIRLGGSGTVRGPWICNDQSTAMAPTGRNVCIPFVKECCSTYHGTDYGISSYYPAFQMNTDSLATSSGWWFTGRWCFAPVHAHRANCAEWRYYNFNHFGSVLTQGATYPKTGCMNYQQNYQLPGIGGYHGNACGGQCGGGFRGQGGQVRVSWC